MNLRVSGPALAIVTLVTMAACGSNSSSTSAAGSGTPAKAAPAKAAPVKAIDVCKVLPAAQAAKLSGQPYTTAVPAAEGWTSGCAYNNDDSTAEGINVNLDTSDAVPNTWSAVHKGNIAEISGLGDKAFWDNDNTLYAMSGSALVQVNGLDSKDKSEALAKVVVDALH